MAGALNPKTVLWRWRRGGSENAVCRPLGPCVSFACASLGTKALKLITEGANQHVNMTLLANCTVATLLRLPHAVFPTKIFSTLVDPTVGEVLAIQLPSASKVLMLATRWCG